MQTGERLKVRAVSSPWHSGVQFLIQQGEAVGKTITMETKEDYMVVDPTFVLSVQEAQILMDDLWNAGLRPTEGSGSAGALLSTQKHLDDMRKIVSKQLDVVLK